MNRGSTRAIVLLLSTLWSAAPDARCPAQSTDAAQAQGSTQSHARPDYIGDNACRSCHAEKTDSFHQTAHYLTSRLPDSSTILGSFAPGSNVMKTSNPELFFRMDRKADDFFETAVEGMDPFVTERKERIAFVVGSGGKGQTYLFWKGDELFELPVSYWKELGWVNSPGYRDGVANFSRPVIPRCLECHGTYFATSGPPPNRYVKAGFVVGVTCEKCHGPGKDHAQREAEKTTKSAGEILNPAGFSRARQMDLCAWCHAGVGTSLRPEFSYVPGEPLPNYLKLAEPDAAAALDVHGSQVELLERSRCFQKSEMTCLTCHDVHRAQRDLQEFSQRCLGCHKPETAMFPRQNHSAASNCVDCHMPLEETNLIVFDQSGKKARPKVRNHWIKVYEAAVQGK